MRGSDPFSDPGFVAGLRPIPSGLEGEQPPWPALDLEGVSPEGAPIRISLGASGGKVLLAFLATRCDGCETFWSGLGPSGPLGEMESVQVVVVTKASPAVDPVEVAGLAGELGPVPVVMDDVAWADYRVGGYPFFVLVDSATRKVLRESVAFGMDDVLALLGAGAAGRAEPDASGLEPGA